MPSITFENEKIGNLDVLISRGNPDSPVIIFLHGFNSCPYRMQDKLSSVIDTFSSATWIFPQAPISIDDPLNFIELEKLPPHIAPERLAEYTSGSEPRWGWFRFAIDFSKPFLVSAALWDISTASNLILELIRQLNIDYSKLILGGFSQGGMIASGVLNYLTIEEKPAGLILCSSCATQPNKIPPDIAKDLPFLITHGYHDMVLSLFVAQETTKTLTEAGMKGNSCFFHNGHILPEEAIEKIIHFINQLFYLENQ